MASLVFIGHEASLTGAPYTQLYILQWLRAHTQHTVELVLLRGGPLVSEFEKVANVHILSDYIEAPNLAQRIIRKYEHVTNVRLRRAVQSIKRKSPSLIFANTVVSLESAVYFKQLLCVPLIINIHELDTIFFQYDITLFKQNAKEVDFFVPASQAVKDLYQSMGMMAEAKTQIVYDFTNDRLNGVSTKEEIRQRFLIPANAKIVGAVGTLGWRKGPDLFLQIAQYLIKSGNENIYFMWVGCNTGSVAYKEMLHDTRMMGLEKRVLFIEAQADVKGFFEAFDAFLLTSREDPFPLVCMEAAMSGCPIVCFEGGGGMPEFVRNDAGYVTPYADVPAMANKALYLLQNENERHQLGLTARNRAVNQHTIKVIGPQINEIINKFLLMS